MKMHYYLRLITSFVFILVCTYSFTQEKIGTVSAKDTYTNKNHIQVFPDQELDAVWVIFGDGTLKLWDFIKNKSLVNTSVGDLQKPHLFRPLNDGKVAVLDGKNLLFLNNKGKTEAKKSLSKIKDFSKVQLSPNGKYLFVVSGSTDTPSDVSIYSIEDKFTLLRKFKEAFVPKSYLDFNAFNAEGNAFHFQDRIKGDLWYEINGEEVTLTHNKQAEGFKCQFNAPYSISANDPKYSIKAEKGTLTCTKYQVELMANLGHSNFIEGMVFSSDSRYIISCSRDKTLKMFDLVNGRELKNHAFDGIRNPFDAGSLHSVDLAPDDQTYAVGSDKMLIVGDIISGEVLFKKEQKYSVNVTKFSPNGDKVLAGCNGSFSLFNAKTGYQLKSANVTKKVLTTAAFSPDGKYIAAGWKGSELQLYDANTLRLVSNLSAHTKKITDVSFSADSKYLVSSADDGTICLWNMTTRQLVRKLNHAGKSYTKSTYGVRISNDGKYIISQGAGTDEKYKKYTTVVWDFNTGEIVRKKDMYGFKLITSPDNKFVAVTTGGAKIISIIDFPSLEIVTQIKPELVWIYEMKQASNNKELFIAFSRGSIRDFNLATGTGNKGIYTYVPDKKDLINGYAAVRTIDINENKKQVVSANWFKDTKNLKIYDKNLTKLIKKVRYSSKGNIDNMNYSNDGKYIAATSKYGKNAMIWNTSTWQLVKEIQFDDDPYTAVFSPDNKLLAVSAFKKHGQGWSASDIATIFIYNTTDWSLVKEIPFTVAGKHSFAPSIDFSNDGKYLAIGTYKGFIKLISTQSLQIVKSVKMKDSYVNVKKIKFSDDSKHIIAGDGVGVIKAFNTETLTPVFQTQAHITTISHVGYLSPDVVVSASHDGLIKFWGAKDGKLIATLYYQQYNNGNFPYLLVTPDGYYMASRDALNNVHYVVNLDYYSFDQFDLQYNRPDIVLKRIGMASESTVNAYEKAWKKRLSKMGFDPANFEKERSFNVPIVNITSSINQLTETTKKDFSFSIQAKDRVYKLERLLVSVNGVPLYGIKGKDLKYLNVKSTKLDIDLQLSKGKNVVSVSVLNEKGVESLKKQFEVTHKPLVEVKPVLHLVTIGVSKFKESDYNLTYADKDARDLARQFQQYNKNYSKVFVHDFLNEKAIASHITGVKKILQQTSVDDEVIIFVASHGLLDSELDYYIGMHNTEFNNPSNGGLKYDDLENLLDGIPARKKIMLIDACHSGEVDKEETTVLASNSSGYGQVKYRGFKKVQTNSTLGLTSSFQLMKELFADLRKGTGATVISSASGAEFAFESSQWRNGVFTYSVLEGLKNRRSDSNKDGEVQISELRDYVFKRVKELTDGKQNPTSRRENLENDFIVW